MSVLSQELRRWDGWDCGSLCDDWAQAFQCWSFGVLRMMDFYLRKEVGEDVWVAEDTEFPVFVDAAPEVGVGDGDLTVNVGDEIWI